MAARTAHRRLVTFWIRIRAVPIVFGVMVLTVVALVLPASAATATPSPGGASIAAACILALLVPVTVAWGCMRGDPLLESVSARSISVLDLALALLGVGMTSAAALGLQAAGLAPAGVIAARAALVYLGLMLMTHAFGGWRIASLAPAVYLLGVIMMGRGEDIRHPATWAWIAADADDLFSWVLTLAVLCAGLSGYLLFPRETSRQSTDE